MPASIDLSLEAPGVAAPVAEGLWILATRHHGGGFTRFPEANNRAVILRLEHPDTGPGLVVVNATDPAQSFEPLRDLCRSTGLDVTYVISPGGGHHSYLGPWHDAFEGAQILIGAERVPRTANGRALLQRPRVAVMDRADPLPWFTGQVDAVTFTGLLGAKEFPSPTEGAPDSIGRMMKALWHLNVPSDPYDELWLHHVASSTVLAGENLAPYWTAEAHSLMPWMVRIAVKAENVAVATAARKVHDKAAVAAAWRAVVAWPARHLLHYHGTVGGAFEGDVSSALRAAAVAAKELPA